MSERDPHDDDAARSTAATGNRAAVDTPATDDTSPEAPEADSFEQHREVVDHDEDVPPTLPFDVDPADAADQHRVVDYDEDDYR